MLPIERQKKMMELLMFKRVMKLSELTDELNISLETLRRDINLLASQGKIEKIYGGVKLIESHFGESVIDERMISHLLEKEMIARKCSEFIHDGDCIYLDSGSTTYQIAKYIKNQKRLTVVTNSIPVITELMDSDVELIIIGGKIRKNEQSVTSYDFLFNFDGLNINKAFVCASGITIEKGISDYNLEEALTRKKIIDISKEVYVAADSTKFEKDVTVGICSLDQIDFIITDNSLSKSIMNKFDQTSTNLICLEK